MGIMAIGRIIVLSALVAQALSAPSGCIESCNFHQTAYQSEHTLGEHQDHANLVQGSTNLNEHDYARPGNWTERNQYSTDSGHGKVHEERGQYVEGSNKVRYYKKNFTSSYGTGRNINGVDASELGESSGQRRYDSIHVPSNQHFDSQSTYGQLGQTVAKETGYNRVHSQQTQSSSTRIDSKSERLEDFGEYGGYSQVNQHVPSISTQTIGTQHVETTPANWRRVDSYKTDGGHGRVFEEEGQFVTGPKKVRYYKKNYTSSYSTSGIPQTSYSTSGIPQTSYSTSGIPQTSVGSVTLDKLHNELQTNLQKQLDTFRRDFHETSSTGHTAATTHVDSTAGLTQGTVGFHSSDLQTAESDAYRQHLGYRRVPSTETVRHYTDQQQRETFTDTRQQLPYTYPTAAADTYGTDSQRTYQSHETYMSRVHPTPQSGYLSPGYVQIPSGSYQAGYHNAHSSGHHLDETHRAEALGAHQSNVQNQLLTETSQRVYNPHSSHITYPSRHGETRHHEEHWSSASHTEGHVAPERTTADQSVHGIGHTERAHYDRDAYNEQRGRYHTGQGYESRARTSGSGYDSAYRTSSGQLVTGSVDLGHMAHGADCVEEAQQYQQETRYHRKYKRDDHHGDVQQHQTTDNEDFTQQNQESQQLEDLTQQSEQFTQQAQGSDDFTQQTSGKLEFGQQTIDNQHLDDLTQQSEQFTQQTEGQLEFGQQTVNNPHLEDLTQQSEQFTQQTQGSDDFTQQTSGKLEFGQQTVDNPRLEDLTQQSEHFTQQTEGQLEFGQQTVNNPHLEDLTQRSEQFTQQKSDDLTQQTNGKLEFGQQTVDNQHFEDLTQQTQGSNDFTQQTSGKLEFGQQTIDDQHLENLAHQSEQFTQQTEGQFEFGQNTADNKHLEDSMQQSEPFVQQTQGSDDFTQQTSGKLEFGQQTDDSQQLEQLQQQTDQFTQRTTRSDSLTQQNQLGKYEFGQQIVGNEHLEDLTQQNKQFSQQGQLEFGQQTIGRFDLDDLKQQSEQLAQQTTGSNDFTQQTVGKLEFGQQMQSIDKPVKPKTQHLEEFNQQSEDLTQQMGGFDDFTQQTMGQLEFGQQVQQSRRSNKPKVGNHHLEDFTQQNEDLTQQVGGFHDFSQQTAGHLEYGQQSEQQEPSWPGHNTQHLEHFSQQNNWDIDNLSQQSHQYPTSYNNENNEQSEWKLEQMSQKTDFDQDFTQQTDQDQQVTIGIKPAPKPKPRQRYPKHDSIPSHTDETDTNPDDIFKPIEVNPEADIDNGRIIQHNSRITYPRSNHHTSRNLHSQTQGSSVFDNQKENMDRLHWVHKSNDATIGSQWHYTYHPSDLTNVEGSHDNYYPRHNVNSMSQQTENVQESNPFEFNQQETQDKHTFEDRHQNAYISQSSQAQHDQQSGSSQQTETSHFDNQFNQNSEQIPSRVIPLQHKENSQLTSEQDKQSTPTTEQTENKIESRILQAYGGGPYDASRSDDFYNRVKPNPSVTLPPMNGDDPWDIREKPREGRIPWTWSTARYIPEAIPTTTTEVAETTTQIIETTSQPTFWNKLGHKITSTYDKAKEKAKEIFG